MIKFSEKKFVRYYNRVSIQRNINKKTPLFKLKVNKIFEF